MKDRIKQIRTHFALSQEHFANKIHKTASFISNVEKGKCGLSDDTIISICSAFSIREEWFRNGSGEMFVVPVSAVDKKRIGSRIKEIRNKAGLSQAEFGERIGFHKNQVYNVENGKSIPSDEFLSAVSREFNVSYLWLRNGENSAKDPVDDRLIEWLRRNPEIAIDLRIRGGLD